LTSTPCWTPACSISTGTSERPATNEAARCAVRSGSPGSRTSIVGPKLMISVTSAVAGSRRRSGRLVSST
jgi:hypothetical protein